jgi:hypothetical protein
MSAIVYESCISRICIFATRARRTSGDHPGRAGRADLARSRRDGRRLGLRHEVARPARVRATSSAIRGVLRDRARRAWQGHRRYVPRLYSLQVSAPAVTGRGLRASVAIGSTIGAALAISSTTCAPREEQSVPPIAVSEDRMLRGAHRRTKRGPPARGTPDLPCSARAHDSHKLSNRPHESCRAH